MGRHVAFLRAINVAGHSPVKMTDLVRAFASAGCANVQTYIQSGNVLFDVPRRTPAALFDDVRVRLGRLLGEEPIVLFRSARQLVRLVRNSPFGDLHSDPEVKLYVAFLMRRPKVKPEFPLISEKEALEAIGMRGSDVFIVSRRKRNGFHGFPNDFIEKKLGTSATSRNWSTLARVAELIS